MFRYFFLCLFNLPKIEGWRKFSSYRRRPRARTKEAIRRPLERKRQTIYIRDKHNHHFSFLKKSSFHTWKSFVDSRTAASFPLGSSPASPDALSLPPPSKNHRNCLLLLLRQRSVLPFPTRLAAAVPEKPDPFPSFLHPSGRVTNQEKEGRESAVSALASIFFPGHLPRFGSVCVSTRVRPSLARERRVFFSCSPLCDPDSSP